MPVAKADPRRVRDIEAAIARAKPRDRLKLEELAQIWGTTKPRFVTTRNQMPAFPDPVDKDGNEYFYPALKALRAMLAYEKRHDEIAKARQSRADAIMGRHRVRRDAEDYGTHTVNELATLARASAEIEERERAQGLYVPRAEVVAIAGDVFAEISELCSRLSLKVDPHGRLTPKLRQDIDGAAAEALLRCQRRMRDILAHDVKRTGTGSEADRPRRPRTRR